MNMNQQDRRNQNQQRYQQQIQQQAQMQTQNTNREVHQSSDRNFADNQVIEILISEYSHFYNWYNNLIDDYKKELYPVLYHTFVYIELTINYQFQKYDYFFKTNKDRFMDKYESELNLIQTVLTNTNMDAPYRNLVEKYTLSNICVYLSKSVYDILYLYVTRHPHIHSLVNNLKIREYQKSSVYPHRFDTNVYPNTTHNNPIKMIEQPLSIDINTKFNLSDSLSPEGSILIPSIAFMTFLNTENKITCIKISPTCKTILAGTEDSKIHVWIYNTNENNNKNTQNGIDSLSSLTEPIHYVLIGHTSSVYDVDIDKDEKYVLSASNDNSIKLWSLETRTCLVNYIGHFSTVWNVKFSPSNSFFASTSMDTTTRIWKTDNLSSIAILPNHMFDVTCCAWHQNGLYLFTGSSDNTVRIWDVSLSECKRIFVLPTPHVTCMCIHPQGEYLALSTYDGSIYIYNIRTQVLFFSMKDHKKSITSLAFSPNGSILASSSLDYSINIYQVIQVKKKPQATVIDNYIEPTENDDNKVIASAENPANIMSISQANAENVVKTDSFVLKDNTLSVTLQKSFSTRSTPIYTLTFLNDKLIVAAGPYCHDEYNLNI